MHKEWTDAELLASDSTRDLIAVPDNGYQLCIAWAAIPDHARRGPRDRDTETVTDVVKVKGEPAIRVSYLSSAEEDWVSPIVNAYLDEAGIPPRPTDWLFYILPATSEHVTQMSEIENRVRRKAIELSKGEPARVDSPPVVLAAAKAVMRDLYRDT